jgi:hypothetical protein
MAVLYGAFSVPFVRGEYASARPVAEQALAVAAKVEDPEASHPALWIAISELQHELG